MIHCILHAVLLLYQHLSGEILNIQSRLFYSTPLVRKYTFSYFTEYPPGSQIYILLFYRSIIFSRFISLYYIPWASAVGYPGEVNYAFRMLAHAARLVGNRRAHRCLPMI